MARITLDVKTRMTGPELAVFQKQVEVMVGTFQKFGLEVSDANVRINQQQKHVNELSRALRNVAANIASLVIFYRAIRSGVRIFADMTTKAFEFNSLLQTSRLSIAALGSAFGTIADKQGNVAEGAEKWTAALSIARDMQNLLRKEAIQTAATYEQLVEALQEATGPAISAGLNKRQIVQFTRDMTLAAQALGVPFNQLGQELRAIFEGDMSRFSRISRQLFMDLQRDLEGTNRTVRDQVELWIQQGTIFQEVEKRLRTFAKAGTESMNTWATAVSNLQDAWTGALGEAFLEATPEAVKAINELIDSIVTFGADGEIAFNEQLVGALKNFAMVALKSIEIFKDAFIITFKPGGVIDTARFFFEETWTNSIDKIAGAFAFLSGFKDNLFAATPSKEDPFEAGLNAMKSFYESEALQTAQMNAELATAGFNNMLASFEAMTKKFPVLQQQFQFTGVTMSTFVQKIEEAAAKGYDMDAIMKQIGKSLDDMKLSGIELNRAIKAGESGIWDFLFGGRKDKIDEQAQKKLQRLREEFEKILATIREMGRESSMRETLSAINDIVQGARNTAFEEIVKIRGEAATKHIKEVERYADALDKVTGLETKLKEILDAGAISLKEYEDAMATLGMVRETEAKTNLQNINNIVKESEKSFEEFINDQRALATKNAKKSLEEAKERIKELKKIYAEERLEFDRIAGGMGRAFEQSFRTIFDGGSLEDAFRALTVNLTDIWSASLSTMIENWFAALAKMAAGQNAAGTGPLTGDDAAAKQQNAKFILGAIGAVGTLANIYNQAGPSRSQNTLSGVLQGAVSGASIGSAAGPYAIIGAVIGAILGGITGALAPTGEKKGFSVQIRNGQLSITGFQDTKEREVEQALRDANKLIADVHKKLQDAFLVLPDSILAAVLSFDIKDLPDFTTEFKSASGIDALRDFLNVKLPGMVLDLYEPAIKGALSLFGVTHERLREIMAHMRSLEFEDAQQFLTDYFQNLRSFLQLQEFLGFSRSSKLSEAKRLSNLTPVDRLDELDSRISILSQGFENLPIQQQIDRANTLRDLIDERYELEIQYLNRIQEIQKSVLEGIDAQIADLRRSQMTPEEAVADILEEQRQLRDQLAHAKTPEEVAMIVSKMQDNVAKMIALAENAPEAIASGIAMLEDIRRVAQERFDSFIDEVENRDKEIYDRITAIVDALLNVSEQWTEVTKPDFIEREIEDLERAIGNLTDMMEELGLHHLRLGDVLDRLIARLQQMLDSTGGDGGGSGGTTGASYTAAPVVTYVQPSVQVFLAGSAEKLITEVAANVIPQAESRIMRTLARQQQRGARR